MSFSTNVIVLTGNLGNNPELKYSQAGKPYCHFNMAFSPAVTSDNNTGWIRVTCFDRTAEICSQYLHKGARVTVVGALDYRSFESNGEKKSQLSIVARNIEFIKINKPVPQEEG